MPISPSSTACSRAISRVQQLEVRIQAFQALSDDQQQVLAVLSLFPITVYRSHLVALCRSFGLLLQGKAPDTTKLTELAERCHSAGLVLWDGNRVATEPDLALFLLRLAADTPFGERLQPKTVELAFSVLPPGDPVDIDTFQARLLRWTRRYAEAGSLLEQCLKQSASHRSTKTWFGPGDPWFVADYVRDWVTLILDTTHTDLRYQKDVSWEMEVFSTLSPSAAPPLDSLLLPMDRPAAPRLRAQLESRRLAASQAYSAASTLWLFLLGRHEEIRANATDLAGGDHPTAEAQLGALELASGNLDKSLQHFVAASSANPADNVPPWQRTWLGVLYVIALLAKRTPESLESAGVAIRRLIGRSTRKHACEVPSAFLHLSFCLAKMTGVSFDNLQKDDAHEQDVFEQLAMVLAHAWLEPPKVVSSAWLEFVKHELARARTIEYPWLVGELNGVARRLAPPTDAGSASGDTTPEPHLVELIHPIAAWQKALDSLERLATINQIPTFRPEGPTVNGRIAWFVRIWGGRLMAEPRLQLERGNGYTKGRSIAIQHFLSPEVAKLPVTASDKRVAQHLHRARARYGADEIYFDETVCLGLIGHPHVFDANDETLHYDVKLGTVALRCEQPKGSEYCLRLKPDVASAEQTEGEPIKAFAERSGTDIWAYEITPQLRQLVQIVGPGLRIPATGEAHLRRLLPKLSALVPTTATLTAPEGEDAVEGETLPVLRIRPKGDTLRVQVLVTPFGPGGPACVPGEGAESGSHFVDGKALQVRRNLAVELGLGTAVWTKLPTLGKPSDDFTWSAPDLPACLSLLSELDRLTATEARVEWPEGQPLRLKRLRSFTLQIAGGNAAEWFEASGELTFDDGAALRIAEVLSRLDQRQGRFVALKNGDYAELTQSALERLALLSAFQAPTEDASRLRLAPWMALLLPSTGQDDCIESGSQRWLLWRRRIEQALGRCYSPTKAFAGVLRDYQLAGFRWMCQMASLGTGVCLADDMGLGKTIQALALLQYRATRKLAPDEPSGPILIVAPASVCPGWLSEASRFTPNLHPRWLTGKARSLEGATRKTLLVCTYEVMHRDIETLKNHHFDTVILDEAHHIKNAHTRRARAAFSLKATFRLATTGTPIENHLGELWSLFHFLMPGLLGDQHHFVTHFRSPIETSHDASRRQQLRLLVQPFMLRRTKQQVLTELPEKTELVRQVPLSSAEAELYEAIRQRGLITLATAVKDQNQQRVRVLAELMRLRRACCHPRLVLPDTDIPSSKLSAFLELVAELRDAGHRALVFSQFVDHLTLVREALDDHGYSYQYLDGSTKLDDREKAVHAFQNGDDDLFLISLRAGGTGLNLTAADYVIHLDPWWNPAVEDQASDRAHRIGQERPVTIYRLVTKGTIEQRLVALHAEKRTLAADILTDFDSKQGLDPEELMHLLRDAALGGSSE